MILEFSDDVAAPPERLFDLSRSVDAHVLSASSTGERVVFSAPLGPLGRLAEVLVLRRYMERFLRDRAAAPAALATSDGWRAYVD